jgi:hypothetical protein
MWPAFIALTVVDAAIAHAIPPAGDSESFADGLMVALFINLLVVAVLARIGGVALRRVRRDLPSIVAKDYAGTTILLAVGLALIVAGLAHRTTVAADRARLADAVARAQAWIGDRAPAEFRRNVARTDTVTIEPGIYRTCVRGDIDARSYCVVVKTELPFARSVVFDGYESNAIFDQGAG